MKNVTRIVHVLYVAAAGVAAVYLGWEKVLVVAGVVTPAASYLANILKDGTWADAIVSGLAINLTDKTTVSPPPAGTIAR